MTSAFVDLLRVVKAEELTLQEVTLLLTCRSKSIKEFSTGALIGGTLAVAASTSFTEKLSLLLFPERRLHIYLLAATWKLSKFARVFFSVGAAGFLGLHRFDRCINSCLDQILDMDGSGIQRELANVIVNKNRDDPWTMQRLRRRFYQEKVFDDSSSDKPIFRWRYRNFYGDNVGHSQKTNASDSPSDSHVSYNDSHGKNLPLEAKKVPMNPGADVMEDPLDSIFGHKAPVEEISSPSSSSKPARANTRSHRRSQRRRRLHHRESLGLKQPQPQLV